MTTFDGEQLDELRRAVLEKRVRTSGSSRASRDCTCARHTSAGPLPLSVSQNQLWYLGQLAPDSPAYNELVTIRKTGPLDVSAVRRALNEVVRRHDALRTTFPSIDGVPHQFVHEPTEIDLPLLDLSHLGPAEAERRAIDVAADDTVVPYDFANGPLIRARLIRITDDDHRLYLGLHHLIFDGVTLHAVIFPELIALYRDYSVGQASSLSEPAAQYADYAAWESEWVADGDVDARIARWRNRLDGLAPALLPTDRPRTSHQRFAGGTIPFTVDHGTVEGLRSAAQQAGGTLFHALAAAYVWWLHSYTGSNDVVFGTPHDLRYRKDLLTVAGYCLTPLVVRCVVSGEESFAGLVERVRDVVTDAVSDAVPFESLIAGLGVARDPRNDPLFQTALVLRPPLTAPTDDWSLHVMEADVSDAVGATKFDINVELTERPEGHLTGRFSFSTDLFDRGTAREMARYWTRLLDMAARAPDTAMADHDMITRDDRRRQLAWNPAPTQSVSSESICDVLRVQVDRTPDAVAVQVGSDSLTYRQLDERASAIASRLVSRGAGRGTVVATLLDRTPDLVATLIGILKAGAAFLPLDPRGPAVRNDFSINDAGANVVVTDRELSHIEAADFDSVAVSPTDLAYVMYTSGSTGGPKGVLVEHRSVTNLMHTMFRTFGVDGSDTVLSVSSVTFDVALGDIFCALACGARFVMATVEQAMNPIELGRLISNVGATYMMATPTTWSALIASGWAGDRRLMAVSAGETLTDALAESLLDRCPVVWNAWGPTEATVIAGGARLRPGEAVTVGYPLAGVRVYVADERGRMQPIGVPGEIAIGGVGVARGYLNRPDEQHRRFAADPFDGDGLTYRTGDRGRFLADGRLQHLGRDDEQVKIRGFRIEPAEIESALCEHPAVKACAVVARDAESGERQLAAYLIGTPDGSVDGEVREWLRRRLPEYMVPSAFVHLDAFPTTSTGKLDRAALPAPSPPRVARPQDQQPRNDVERRVAELWTTLLGIPVSDVNTDFFDLGGHSLLAVRLIFEAERTFGISLSLPTFLDTGRTVASLAALIGAGEAEEHGGAETGSSPLHVIYPDLASAMSTRHFAAQWGSAHPLHPLVLPQRDGPFDLSREIERLADELMSAIRQRQPRGPYALAGYSLGATVSYEIARQLVEAGERVDWLGIFDSPPPPIVRLLRTPWARLRRFPRLPPGERWAKGREVARRILRRRLAASSPPQYDVRVAREITCRYDKPGHAVPMHLFVTKGSAAYVGAELLGWEDFHRGELIVERFGGNHITLLNQPQVQDVARVVLKSLRDAENARNF